MNFTIRAKLTALYFLVLAASLSVFVWISDVGFRRSIEVSVSDASAVNLKSLRRLIEINAPKGDPKVRKELAELAAWWPSGAVFEVKDSNGDWIFRSAQFLKSAVPFPATHNSDTEFFTTNLDHVQYRIALTRFETDGRTFEIHAAVPTEPFDRALDNFRDIEKRTVPLLVVLASLFGYWLSGRSLAPVTRIIQTAERIGVNNLSQRLEVPKANDELRRLTQALNAMLERIESSFKRIARFTADASHDLRTPVSVIRTMAEVTLQRRRTGDQYEEALSKILATSEETTQLIENLLTLARADAGTVGMELHLLDLNHNVQKARERAELLATNKSLDIRAVTTGNPALIRGDAIAIDRLLMILMDNAIKYTPEGGFVEIELSPGVTQVAIEVRDSGIGIARHELELIFDRSYRTDRARSRQTGGAGLGLAIARWITELHGGTVIAESEIGVGSTFRVTLPAAQLAEFREPHPAATASAV
jgi:heavy metal sensor kinase